MNGESVNSSSGFHLLKGPLGGYQNYLSYVAFPNCIDYFDLLKLQRSNFRTTTTDLYKRFRYFINALESMNNVPDYFYFDLSFDSESIKLESLRKALYSISPCLEAVNEIANAYKHCVRGRWDSKTEKFQKNDKLKCAKDLAETQVAFRAGMRAGRPVLETDFVFQSLDNETVITDAFQFWHGYLESGSETLYLKIIEKVKEPL